VKEKYVTAEVTTTKKGIKVSIWIPASAIGDLGKKTVLRLAESLKKEEAPEFIAKAEEDMQSRDPASTTSCSAERRWSQHIETPASSFGFVK
jgi:hypothetical protein